MKLSVIVSTFNRADLLNRTLFTYSKQSMPKDDYEVIIIDDQSTDDTESVINSFKDKLNLIYARIKGKKEGFRAQSVGWNIGLKIALSEVCLFSHPEIMMPYKAFKEMCEPHQSYDTPVFLTMKPYFLSMAAQEKIDQIDWKDDADKIKELKEFSAGWNYKDQAFTSEYMEKLEKWHSNTTFSMKRLDLIGIGGFDEFDRWGPDDASLRDRRKRLHIKSVISPLLNYHQNHDSRSGDVRKMDFKTKWYPFASSAKLRMKDHSGEYEIVFSYRRV